jgi:hypothetical protein
MIDELEDFQDFILALGMLSIIINLAKSSQKSQNLHNDN